VSFGQKRDHCELYDLALAEHHQANVVEEPVRQAQKIAANFGSRFHRLG
jgi:hypothetical protein